jgi:hypothetical protein
MNKNNYENMYRNLTELLHKANITDKVKFVSFSLPPVIYLDASMYYGTFSSWNYEYTDKMLEKRYSEYYKLNPNKIPNVIFCNNMDDMHRWFDVSEYTKFEYNESVLYVKR